MEGGICAWQHSSEDGTLCGSRLLEGLKLGCPYSVKDIRVIDEYGSGGYRLGVQVNSRPGADGVCRDLEILFSVKDEFIKDFIREADSHDNKVEDIVEELEKTESSLTSKF